MTSPRNTIDQLKRFINDLVFQPEEILENTTTIYSQVINNPKYINEGNFTKINPDVLGFLFKQYDSEFFGGLLKNAIDHENRCHLVFTFSQRMTKAGGKTKYSKKTMRTGNKRYVVTTFEISISSTLLYQSFRDVKRTITVNGIVCQDRLEALQRIFEHELIHFIEIFLWKKSSCSAHQFKRLVRHIFGHNETTHQLITQTERALNKFGIKIGSTVEFSHDGENYRGIVNRITKRATILVKHKDGSRYSDNKRYLKFYIPLSMLKKIR